MISQESGFHAEAGETRFAPSTLSTRGVRRGAPGGWWLVGPQHVTSPPQPGPGQPPAVACPPLPVPRQPLNVCDGRTGDGSLGRLTHPKTVAVSEGNHVTVVMLKEEKCDKDYYPVSLLSLNTTGHKSHSVFCSEKGLRMAE